MNKKIASVEMKSIYTVYEAEEGYQVMQVKAKDDTGGRIEAIESEVVDEVEKNLIAGSYDIEEIFSHLKSKSITNEWKYYYGRDGRHQKFYLRKILCVLIALKKISWAKEGKKYIYTI